MEAFGERLAGNGGDSAVLIRVGAAVAAASRGGKPDAGKNVRPLRQSIAMEALTEQLAGHGGSPAVQTHPAAPTLPGWGSMAGLAAAIAMVNAAAAAAPDQLAMAGYQEAAEFAGLVEELSRSTDYLQIIGAGTVDRTRTQGHHRRRRHPGRQVMDHRLGQRHRNRKRNRRGLARRPRPRHRHRSRKPRFPGNPGSREHADPCSPVSGR